MRYATIILLMFRHRLRSAELVALEWSSVDFKNGYLAIHRVKHGHDSVYPLRYPELRALRQLKLNYPDTQYVFVSELKVSLPTRSSPSFLELPSGRTKGARYIKIENADLTLQLAS